MSEKKTKKKYTTPEIYRVELNQEQAILAACSSLNTSRSDSGTRRCRNTAPVCRRSSRNSGDSAVPPS